MNQKKDEADEILAKYFSLQDIIDEKAQQKARQENDPEYQRLKIEADKYHHEYKFDTDAAIEFALSLTKTEKEEAKAFNISPIEIYARETESKNYNNLTISDFQKAKERFEHAIDIAKKEMKKPDPKTAAWNITYIEQEEAKMQQEKQAREDTSKDDRKNKILTLVGGVIGGFIGGSIGAFVFGVGAVPGALAGAAIGGAFLGKLIGQLAGMITGRIAVSAGLGKNNPPLPTLTPEEQIEARQRAKISKKSDLAILTKLGASPNAPNEIKRTAQKQSIQNIALSPPTSQSSTLPSPTQKKPRK